MPHTLIAEISISGYFDIHHQLWSSSVFRDQPSKQTYKFALLADLEQLFQDLIIPDCLGAMQHAQPSNISLISKPAYSVGLYPPCGLLRLRPSLLWLLCSIWTHRGRRCFCHYALACCSCSSYGSSPLYYKNNNKDNEVPGNRTYTHATCKWVSRVAHIIQFYLRRKIPKDTSLHCC